MEELQALATSLAKTEDSLPSDFGMFDGREQLCLEYVKAHAEPNPKSVIQAIDQFCYSNRWMMNVGDFKGRFLTESLDRVKPKTVLELGTYVGYSSLMMITRLNEDARIVTVDISKRASNIARQMFDFAGVSHRIQSVVGFLGDKDGSTVRVLESEYGIAVRSLDFVFIDHAKESYLPDLKTILSRSWLHKGSVMFADNVLFPGAPDYRNFMKINEGKIFNTKEIPAFVEYQTKIPDLVLESVYIQSDTSAEHKL